MAKIQTSLTIADVTLDRLQEIATANSMTLSGLVGELLQVAMALGPMSFSRVAPEHEEYVLQLGELTLGYQWDKGKGVFYPRVIYRATPMIPGTLPIPNTTGL